jgi:hypothetical protein
MANSTSAICFLVVVMAIIGGCGRTKTHKDTDNFLVTVE